MGLLEIDENCKVTDFVEKPKEIDPKFLLKDEFFEKWKAKAPKSPSYLGSMGIYIFKRQALVDLLTNDPRHDFGYHLITDSVKKEKTYSFVFCGYWEDIGTVASYYEANLILTRTTDGLNTYDERNPIYTRPTFLPGPKIQKTKITQSIICEGCLIEAEEISNSVIGLRSHIQKGSVVRDTVMLGNHFYMPPTLGGKLLDQDFWIGENCLIEKAIIDEHVQIGHNVKLINKEKHQHFDGPDGVFVRDGIIVVTAGTKLPDGYEF
jgi:glucose-1-phosphate adenylyltransferase